VSFARSWAAIGAASGDESGGEEEFGYVAAVVHDLRAALNLGDRGLDLDPEAAVHQLRDPGVQRDGATEVNHPRTDTGPRRGGIRPGNDVGEQAAGEQEMGVQQPGPDGWLVSML
jgi:hypothetical protein